jgi:TetR/AcrR family transcriptional regulator, mexJK operon transcriptional repressor
MPRGADNDTLILEAARALFHEHGYGDTSMDAVARSAGVSKATVYARFRSKDELFVAVVVDQGRDQTVFLSKVDSVEIVDALRAFGRRAANLLLSDEVIAIYRMVAAEARRAPEIGPLFWANGPEQLLSGLTSFLRDAMRAGQLRTAPPRLAAAQFLAIIVGDLQLRHLVGNAGDVTTTERRKVVESGIDVFLRAYAPC